MVFKVLSALPRLVGLGDPVAEPAERALDIAMAQSRQPEFYLDFGVPDTIEGRFDLLTLHLWMVLRRTRRLPIGQVFGQRLFDLTFDRVDANLREAGTGDTVVGKKVRAHAETFYGRATAYEAGLDAAPGGETSLDAAIARNVFGSEDPETGAPLAAYVRRALAHLDAQPDDAIAAGTFTFPPTAEKAVP